MTKDLDTKKRYAEKYGSLLGAIIYAAKTKIQYRTINFSLAIAAFTLGLIQVPWLVYEWFYGDLELLGAMLWHMSILLALAGGTIALQTDQIKRLRYQNLVEFYAEELADLEKEATREADLQNRDITDEGDHSTGRYEMVIDVEKKLKKKLGMDHKEIMEKYERMNK